MKNIGDRLIFSIILVNVFRILLFLLIKHVQREVFLLQTLLSTCWKFYIKFCVMQFNITLCNHITLSPELKNLIGTAVAGVTYHRCWI